MLVNSVSRTGIDDSIAGPGRRHSMPVTIITGVELLDSKNLFFIFA